jgi:hypothetical protein
MAAPSYAIASKASELKRRVIYVIEREVPELAPSVLYRLHTDTTCRLDDVTEPERFRLFEVIFETPNLGGDHWGESKNAYATRFRVRMGYPLGAYEEIEGTEYLVDELKDHDFEQLDDVLEGGAPFAALDADHPAIGDFKIIALEGQVDRGRVRETIYQIDYDRTR